MSEREELQRAMCEALDKGVLLSDLVKMMDRLAQMPAPPEWRGGGDPGEQIFEVSRAGYTARIIEGRVWRWQAGSDETPAIYAGRIVGGLDAAKQAAEAALVLLKLGELSDLAPEAVHKGNGGRA